MDWPITPGLGTSANFRTLSSEASFLGVDLLPVEGSDTSIDQGSIAEVKDSDSLEEIQRQHILRVLERTGWVISGPNGAGAILDLHPNTLRSLMNRLGIRRPTRSVSCLPVRSADAIHGIAS